ncbi:MAG: hypothetical protein K2P65_11435, partial [Lachnospiraceae bacterium]|nr:hypothetical protein [Lachnospiraceae bacterium]
LVIIPMDLSCQWIYHANGFIMPMDLRNTSAKLKAEKSACLNIRLSPHWFCSFLYVWFSVYFMFVYLTFRLFNSSFALH